MSLGYELWLESVCANECRTIKTNSDDKVEWKSIFRSIISSHQLDGTTNR